MERESVLPLWRCSQSGFLPFRLISCHLLLAYLCKNFGGSCVDSSGSKYYCFVNDIRKKRYFGYLLNAVNVPLSCLDRGYWQKNITVVRCDNIYPLVTRPDSIFLNIHFLFQCCCCLFDCSHYHKFQS